MQERARRQRLSRRTSKRLTVRPRLVLALALAVLFAPGGYAVAEGVAGSSDEVTDATGAPASIECPEADAAFARAGVRHPEPYAGSCLSRQEVESKLAPTLREDVSRLREVAGSDFAISAGLAIAQTTDSDSDSLSNLPTVPPSVLSARERAEYEQRAEAMQQPPQDVEENGIPEGEPSDELVTRCDVRSASGRDLSCRAILAWGRGELAPGDYTNEELKAELAD